MHEVVTLLDGPLWPAEPELSPQERLLSSCSSTTGQGGAFSTCTWLQSIIHGYKAGKALHAAAANHEHTAAVQLPGGGVSNAVSAQLDAVSHHRPAMPAMLVTVASRRLSAPICYSMPSGD